MENQHSSTMSEILCLIHYYYEYREGNKKSEFNKKIFFSAVFTCVSLIQNIKYHLVAL